jgi:hypothetical protein
METGERLKSNHARILPQPSACINIGTLDLAMRKKPAVLGGII